MSLFIMDKQQKTHIVRKSRLGKFSSLAFIGPRLNRVQPFKNSKIYLEIYSCPDGVSGNPYMYISLITSCSFP